MKFAKRLLAFVLAFILVFGNIGDAVAYAISDEAGAEPALVDVTFKVNVLSDAGAEEKQITRQVPLGALIGEPTADELAQLALPAGAVLNGWYTDVGLTVKADFDTLTAVEGQVLFASVTVPAAPAPAEDAPAEEPAPADEAAETEPGEGSEAASDQSSDAQSSDTPAEEPVGEPVEEAPAESESGIMPTSVYEGVISEVDVEQAGQYIVNFEIYVNDVLVTVDALAVDKGAGFEYTQESRPGYVCEVTCDDYDVSYDPGTGLVTGTPDEDDATVKISWTSQEVEYKVEHVDEEGNLISLDGITTERTNPETKFVKAGEITEAEPITELLDSWTVESVDNEEAAGEGGTVVQVHYKHRQYRLNYDSLGGSYVAPKYGDYQAEVNVYSLTPGASCDKQEHTHIQPTHEASWWYSGDTEGCYTCESHGQGRNTTYSWELSCGKEEHTHSEACQRAASYDPAPTRQGYTFGGWYTDPDCTVAADTTTTLDSDKTVYAKWIPGSANYTIVYMKELLDSDNQSYYAFSGSLPGTGTVGQTVTASGGTRPSGYYNSTASRSTSAELKADGSTVVYQYFNLKEYTYTFNINNSDATLHKGGQSYTGSQYTLKVKLGMDIADMWPTKADFTPENQGNRFYGWNPSGAKSTSRFVTKRFEVTEEMLPNNGNGNGVTFTGNWQGNLSSCTVEYWLQDAEGDGYTKSDYYSETYYSTQNVSAKEIAGFTYRSWTPSGYSGTSGNTSRFYYDRNTYSITFMYHDQELKTQEGVRFGADITGYSGEKDRPAGLDADMIFDGWYDNAELTGDPYTFGTMPSNDLVLYANYHPPVVHVTVKYNDGKTEDQTVELYKGQTLGELAVPDRMDEGYFFDGWFSGEEQFDINKPVEQDITVEAHWYAFGTTSYTVNYVAGDKVLGSDTFTNKDVGDTYTIYPKNFLGYLPLNEKQYTDPLTADAEKNVFTVEYKSIDSIQYVIVYQRNGDEFKRGDETAAPASSFKIAADAAVIEAQNQLGYTLEDSSSMVVTVDPNKEVNEFVFNFVPTAYSITYTGIEGATVESNPGTYTVESADITLNNPSKEGYIFLGWSMGDDTYVAEIAENKLHDKDHVVIETGTKGDLNFVANWVPVAVITYEAEPNEGGSVDLSNETIWNFGQEARGSTAKAAEGWKFTGWTLKDSKEVISVKLTFIPEQVEVPGIFGPYEFYESATYVAHFEEDLSKTKELKYTVQYYKDGEPAGDPEEFTENVWINAPDTLTVQKEIDQSDDRYPGYTLKSTEPEAIPGVGEEVADGTTIKLFYVKDESKTVDTSYSVEYYKDSEKVEADSYTKNSTDWAGNSEHKIAIQEAIDQSDDRYPGYSLKSTDPETVPGVGEEVADGTTIKLFYVKDDSRTVDTSYSVEYYKDGEKVEADSYTKNSTDWAGNSEHKIAIQKAIDQNPDKYLGYKLESTDPSPVPAKGEEVADGTMITLKYVKDESQTKELKYTVKYFQDGAEVSSQDYTKEVWVNDPDTLAVQEEIDASNNKYVGYKFDHTEPAEVPATGSLVENETVIGVYYVKDDSQQKELKYTVQYYKDGIPADSEEFAEKVWVNDPDTLAVQEEIDTSNNKYVGYKFDHTDPTAVPAKDSLVENETVIGVYYVKDEEQTKELKYTVKYFQDGAEVSSKDYTEEVWINDPDTLAVQEEIDTSNNKYVGFKFDHTEPTEVPAKDSLVENETVIGVYYVKDDSQTKTLKYTVQYYKDGELADSKEFTEAVWVNSGQTTLTVQEGSVNTDNYFGEGWTFEKVDPSPVPGTVKDSAVINVYYTADNDNNEIPDKYEDTVTYDVVNGTWAEGDKAQKSEDVVFGEKDENGNWVEKNEVTLESVPTDMQADTGYTGGNWTPETPDTVTKDGDKAFTYTFEKDRFNVTVKYVADDGTDLEKDPYTESVVFEAEYDVSGEIPDSVVVDGKTYAKDTVVGNVTGAMDADGEEVTVTYSLDEKGPDGNGPDGVPDKYQVTVTYQIENGKWSDGTAEPKTETVTLVDESGKWSEDGSAKLTPPTNMQPNDGYTGGTWDEEPGTVTKANDGDVYTYSYEKGSFEYTVNYYYDGELGGTSTESGTFGEKIPYDVSSPKTHNDHNYVLESVSNENGTITSDSSKNVVNVYYVIDEKGTDPEEPEKPGDGTPDKYQVEVTYKVENGTWFDGTTVDKTEVVTLVDDEGKWSEDGTATLAGQDGMRPNDGYTGGAWKDETPGTVTKADDGDVYTYSYQKGSFGYTVNYYYDDVQAEDETVNGTGTFGDAITYDATSPKTYNDHNYVLESVTNKDGTITSDSSKNVVDVYYVIDEKGTDPDDPDKPGDGTPDKYQMTIIYVADPENGGVIDEEGATEKTVVQTIRDNNQNLAKEGVVTAYAEAKAKDGFVFENWTVDPEIKEVAAIALMMDGDKALLDKRFEAKGGETYTFTAHFAKDTIGTDPKDPDEPGDNIPDKYQAEVIYQSADNNGSVDPAGSEITTFEGNETSGIVNAKSTATAAEGYAFDYWDLNGEAIESEAALEQSFPSEGDKIYVYTAHFAIDANDDDIPDYRQDLIINVAGRTASYVYDGTPKTAEGFDVTRVTVDGEPVNGIPEGVSIRTNAASVTETDQGVYAMGLDASDFTVEEGSYASVTVIVIDGSLTITTQSIDPTDPTDPDPDDPDKPVYGGVKIDDPSDHIYDGEAHQWAPTVTDKDGKVLTEGTDYTVSYDTEDFTNVTGTITVTIEGTGNYSGTVKKTYQITPRGYSVTTESASKVYDGQPLTAPGSIEGLVDEADATLNITGEQIAAGSSANTYEVQFSSEQMAKNYERTGESLGVLTVHPNSIDPGTDPDIPTPPDPGTDPDPEPDPVFDNVTVGQLPDVVYNGLAQAQAPAVTDKYGNVLTEGVDYVLTYSNDVTNTGTVTVTVTGIGNYSGTVTRNYNITPATVTVTANNATKAAGAADPAFTAVVTGMVNGEDPGLIQYALGRAPGEAVGNYAITPAGAARQGNYIVNYVAGTLTITPAPADGPDDGPDDGPAPDDGPDNGPVNIDEDDTPLAAGPDEVQMEEDEVPLAAMPDIGECCILHLIIMLCALATAVYYTHDRKKRQEEEFETRAQLL